MLLCHMRRRFAICAAALPYAPGRASRERERQRQSHQHHQNRIPGLLWMMLE
jgi:hypothetical protein